MTTKLAVDDPDNREATTVRGRAGSMWMDMTTRLASEDARGFTSTADTAASMVSVKRVPTSTAGTFMSNGGVNLTQGGAAGGTGDYLIKIRVEVKAVTTGGKAGIYVSQLADTMFARSIAVGAAIAGTSSQSFTAAATLIASANLLSDRVISIMYTPTTPGGVAHWFTTRIVSHAAIAGATFTLVLEDTPDAGGVPTEWIIHGPRARRELAPASTEGPYILTCQYSSQTGGLVAWVGSGIVSADFFGVFTG